MTDEAAGRAASDTDAETRRVHGELLRRASASLRLRLACSLSRSVMGLSLRGLARRAPGASPEEVGLRFVALQYGAELAEEVRRHLATRRSRARRV